MVNHDEYLSLSNIVESYFPKTDVRLCIVHFMRNLKKHLTPEKFRKVKKFLDSIKSQSLTNEYELLLFKEMLEIMREKIPLMLRWWIFSFY